MQRLNNTGETIVEVLISIAMLSISIVGSIVVARESILLGQSANERTQALKIVEAQIERLKARAPQDADNQGASDSVFNDGSEYCLDDSLQMVSAPFPTNSDVDRISCSNDKFPPSNLQVSIKYLKDGPTVSDFDDDLFVVTAEWDNVRGGQRDKVVIDYRLHPITR
ncbi:hypothetical protein KC878_00360 [Candidatus Saccharibacteria bacterium]|nr:hypothetical protein [Candidatus Saccharibacteria bacterium]MCB9821238.1 hypothetical protein [Candidatus Nomurabacteria bacterium]